MFLTPYIHPDTEHFVVHFSSALDLVQHDGFNLITIRGSKYEMDTILHAKAFSKVSK